jgi:cell filamentation protein
MGIKSELEMEEVENVALKQAEDYFFGFYDAKHRFTAKDICNMHKVWLGRIYPWAGQYRSVDLTKGIRFAHAKLVPELMRTFETESLVQYTPCNFKSTKELIRALAEVHVEFVLIHPFREGNGRIARVLTTLMALQAAKPILDFNSIQQGSGKEQYFEAIRAGFDRHYDPMQKVIEEILKRTLDCQTGGK